MYRITDRRHTDAMIAAKNRGVPIRLISDPQQYRDPTRLWDAWNIDPYVRGRHRDQDASAPGTQSREAPVSG